ncbi:MAG: ATP-binding protein [Sporomusaceae bacterium]|nr:ATP-binding protein [Sporomusaceae bacterium]
MQYPHSYRRWCAQALTRLFALTLLLALPAAPLAAGQSAAASPVKSKVLLLYTQSMDSSFNIAFTAGFKQRLAADDSREFEYFSENLEVLSYSPNDTVARAIAEVLRQKYRYSRPDIIVVHSPVGIRFLDTYCDDIFGDTPVLAFSTLTLDITPALLHPNRTYCIPAFDPLKNAALILELVPAVERLYVVLGRSEAERDLREELPRRLAPLAGQVAINYLDYLALPELIDHLAALDKPAAVLFVDFARDNYGSPLVPAQIARSLAAASPAPVFGSYSTHIGDGGAVGGYVLNIGSLGRAVGEKALAILQGRTAPGTLETLDIAEYRFDAAELQRWSIGESTLPAGSIVINRRPSLWQTHKWSIIVTSLFALAVVSLLVALIALHSRRRLAAERRALLGEALLGRQEEIIRERTSELIEAEERFRGIFHHSPAMIAIYSMVDDRHVEANRKYLDTLGYTRDEVSGRTAKDLGIRVNLDERKAAKLLHTLRTAGELPLAEYKLRTKTGKLVTVMTTTTLVHIGDEPCRIAIMQDISKEKLLEADMARLDRLNLVGEMAAGIGHEVRNPMTTVRGYLQLFQRKNELAGYKSQLAMMIDELDRANSIISEFLSLAKNKTSDLKPGSLNDALAAILPLLQADALRTGHSVELRTSPVPSILFDEKELRQLVLNLTRNALEAMPGGGVVTIATSPAAEGRIVLAVSDTGRGIPKSVIKKIGTPFFTTKDNGTGLGLSVCYRIAQRHRAAVDFATGMDGTTFYVRFPVKP